MRAIFKLVFLISFAASPLHSLNAQDLAPRAYIITPIHWNAITLTYSFSDGGVFTDNAIPLTDAKATLNVPIFNYFHSFSFFGRSANILASLPYGVAHYQGTFQDNESKIYRSGLLDSAFRFSVNIKGGPAMSVKEYQSWKQKTILGASLRVVAPTGQYDGTKLVNNGSNRWGFKPEFGYSERWGHWVVDAYAGAWFYTTNAEFFSHNAFVSGNQTRSQSPIVSFEGHLSYDVKQRLWFSFDGNFWHGGATSLNGVENPDTVQTSSRIGATASFPLNKHQSLKVSYSNGAYVRFGGNFQNLSVAWQYSWLGRPN
jgi:Putative MetA-pathway of phenol degradation